MRILRLSVALLVVTAPTPSPAAPGDITTVAGGGLGEGPALFIAQEPAGVVVSGHFVYVADSGNNVVRRLDTLTGIEIVVAGNGSHGFSGDGGPATSAQPNNPSGVAVDAAGNLFIADAGNKRIRMVQAPLPPTATATPTPTVTGTPPTASPTATMQCGGGPACVGDCNGDGKVGVSELITMVNSALDNSPTMACTAGDANGDCLISIDEIIAAVNHALNGCMLTPEQGCLMSGGSVAVASCCASTGDFPDTCAIGACGCGPAGSHDVRVCRCGTGTCFNGSACVGE